MPCAGFVKIVPAVGDIWHLYDLSKEDRHQRFLLWMWHVDKIQNCSQGFLCIYEMQMCVSIFQGTADKYSEAHDDYNNFANYTTYAASSEFQLHAGRYLSCSHITVIYNGSKASPYHPCPPGSLQSVWGWGAWLRRPRLCWGHELEQVLGLLRLHLKPRISLDNL